VPLRLPTFGLAHMVMAVALLLVGLFLYATVQTAAQSYRLHREQRQLDQEVTTLRRQRSELQGLLTYLNSDEYIEAFARQQFGLVRPGEIAVDVQAPSQVAATVKPGERWWEVLFGLGGPVTTP
jgi:cell division protein FtsB